MTEILHRTLPYNPMTPRPLPGIEPLAPEDWLRFDEGFAPQMQERTRLLRDHADAVLAMAPEAEPAAQELLDHVLAARYGAGRQVQRITRPDGIEVALNRAAPMETLGHIAQQDFCILEKPEGSTEHILTAAVLCFPASWTLSEKVMKPLLAIHAPVQDYDSGIARRVQRLFDGVQAGRPLWRFNALWYADPSLYQPRLEQDPRPTSTPETRAYLRSELQSIYRLPQTRAVVFSIHTQVLARADVLSQWGDEKTPQ
ncbi:heme-dependent oxidative N-demethylase family protein [Tritonibacter mobilis]|uniref:heme-dependent oxidative N-demethylase family protein n=1 Tax=Tritonibacter mobilis TaxID=379347 RepID=UPI003A5C3144